MLAKLVEADIAPQRVDDAARTVQYELIPLFLSHPGARHGYWLANRTTGRVLIMTVWSDQESLESERTADGQERATAVERLGLRIRTVQTLAVLSFTESAAVSTPVLRSARATWVEGVSPDLDESLRTMHQDVVPQQAASPGFCASYWLANRQNANGVGLSLWADAASLQAGEGASSRRRRRFEKTVGCRINQIQEFDAIGVIAPRDQPAKVISLPAAFVDLTKQAEPHSPRTVL